MTIFKMANEQKAPAWPINATASLEIENISPMVNTTLASSITEEVIAKECDKIEICASKNESYWYNSSWDKEVINHLKEYALACGLSQKNFRCANITTKTANMGETMIKIASKDNGKVDQLKNALGDPFNLDKKFASEEPKQKWQIISKEAKMKEAPSLVNKAIVPVRGGENYNLNSDTNPAKNQNSITNPDAIKNLVESSEQDTSIRLKMEKAEREQARQKERLSQETEMINNMIHRDIIPKGLVFPTESLNAQNGLNSPMSERISSRFDKNMIPDKTAGEMLKEQSQQYKKSIQRERLEDDPMQMSREATRTVSSILAKELEKKLKGK
jgi:hypothetical protein